MVLESYKANNYACRDIWVFTIFLSLSPNIHTFLMVIQTDRQTNIQIHKQTDKHKNKQGDRQTNTNKRVKIKILKFNKGKYCAFEEIWVFMVSFSFPNIQTLTHFAHHNPFLLLKQTDKQTNRQTDKQKSRQTNTLCSS